MGCILKKVQEKEVEKQPLDLTKILDGCPRGTKLYSPICGEVEFTKITNDTDYPIECRSKNAGFMMFNKRGQYIEGGECMLFPYKEYRDWSKFKQKKSKFDPKTLQPFDRVLARYNKSCRWKALFFSHCYVTQDNENIYVCDSAEYMYCIPFDDNTKHLVGTKDEAPEYYRYWED